ncbi:uncharacterized protein J4E87_001541 [Alternaria ethzedia]|uniref:uncharacterized protein n=1 Tax=Alternaria ethzedia TaxID=181014 RepID=UPI0020C220C1|nr:uncharacterized protein J4E87_001541 [Alternaria ethzedia]KAI4632070.1 hypothetical protein J4E87_001541 [Alternaria ethzedia]
MDRYQQYGTQVKEEDAELEDWIPIKQEEGLAEQVPTVVPKAGSSGESTLTSYRRQNKQDRRREIQRSTGKRKRGPRTKKPPKRVRLAEKLRKAEEMSHQPGKKEIRDSQIQQELSDTRKMIADLKARSQVGAPDVQISPPHHVPEPSVMTKETRTIAAIRADIARLEQELKEACRQGENAIRDARATGNNDGDVEALEKELAREQGKDRATVRRMQKALKKEQDKSEEAHSGSHQVIEQEASMPGWPGSRDLPIRQLIKVEDEDM